MIARRVLLMIPTLLGVALLAFFINRVLPGDPALQILGDQASQEQLERLRDQMGLNLPVWQQFLNYLWGVIRFDYGMAWHTSRPVIEDLATRLPATIELALWAFVFAVLIGVPFGIIQAVRSGTVTDVVMRVVALVGVSIPGFWLAIQLIQTFYVNLAIAPAPAGRIGSREFPPENITGLYVLDSLLTGNWPLLASSIQHMILPAASMGVASIAVISRMTRSAMLDVLLQDYIRTARSKGIGPTNIIMKHALKNAAPAIFTITALQMGYLLAGAVIIESIYSWPGIGLYVYQSILASDYAPVQAIMVLTAGVFVVVNLIADVLQVIVSPKTRGA
ncbi:ABC transporter permease [Microbacterium paludicola]|nr:ABC transporter permease [Microbacterium paludicola]